MSDDYISFIGVVGTLLGLIGFTSTVFIKHWESREILRNPLTYCVLAINLVVTTFLPLSLWCEFPPRPGATYATFPFYCEYYPHIVVFPALLFGFASLFVLRAALLRWAISKNAVITRLVIAAVIALVVMFYEATGGYMMLLEFNKESQTSTKQFKDPDVIDNAKALGIDQAFAAPMVKQVKDALSSANGTSQIATVLNNYDGWSQLDAGWKSHSRPVYLTMFFYMIFVMTMGFALLPPVRNLVGGDKRVDSLISLNLAGALIIFLMWMPFRMFYNLHTKMPIFGSKINDNFLGAIPFFSIAGLTPAEVLPILVILGFLVFLTLRTVEISKLALLIIVSSVSFVVIVGSATLAVFQPDAFGQIYGLNGNLKHLGFRVGLISLLLLLTYTFISSQLDTAHEMENAPPKRRG